MVKRQKIILLTVFMMAFVLGCSDSVTNNQKEDTAAIRESLARTNQLLLSAEKQEIADFIERHGWDMKQSGSGLHYWIYQKGDGPRAKPGMRALISYQIHLLTGDLVYSSHDAGPKEFTIGRGGVESGLEEAVLLLNQGDRAKFIMPSHLAHGLPGDGIRIPKRATIVYDVELFELK